LFSAIFQYATATGHPVYLWLAVAGVLNSVISLYYYLKIPKAMYLESSHAEPIPVSGAMAAVAVVGAMGVLALFIFPQPLWDLALTAAKGF
ncbi:MAG: NADH-quinone oxidoreductase subunit N, partial [Cyanobacteria bacterium REEB65]|nr:NADH-quinone oxidoreductase subunit N [Cyanobacteria bacterium REEB65]